MFFFLGLFWLTTDLPFLLLPCFPLCFPLQGPELFLDNFLSDETDTPEVVWNDDMKDRLRNFLESDLESYVQARASDPHAVYMYSAKDPIVYPELAGRWEGARGWICDGGTEHGSTSVILQPHSTCIVYPELAGGWDGTCRNVVIHL